jgi:hypothetical protein
MFAFAFRMFCCEDVLFSVISGVHNALLHARCCVHQGLVHAARNIEHPSWDACAFVRAHRFREQSGVSHG